MELLAHLFIVVFAAFIAILAVPGSSPFSWHPTCMTLAALLWTESIICFRRPRPTWRVNIHWALNATAITLAINGFLAIYRNKENDEKPHFVTYHGLAGAATMILVLIQTVGGNLAKFSVLLAKFLPLKPAFIKWGHRVSGVLSITAVYTSLLLGISSNWFTAIISSALIWWGIAVCLVYTYLYAVFNVNFSGPKRELEKSKV